MEDQTIITFTKGQLLILCTAIIWARISSSGALESKPNAVNFLKWEEFEQLYNYKGNERIDSIKASEMTKMNFMD